MAARIERRLGLAMLAGLGLAAAYLLARLAAPAAAPVGAAAVAAIALYPLHRRVLRGLAFSPGAAAGVSTVVVVLGLAAPLGGALWAAADQAASALEAARAAVQAPAQDWAYGFADVLNENADVLAPLAARSAGAVVRGARSLAGFALVFPLALFLFFRDGPGLVERLLRLLPLSPRVKSAVSEDLCAAVAAAAQAMGAVAVVQGVLAAAGFALFRVPFAALLGLLCAVLSPIPFVGSALVWAPVALRVASAGRVWAALGLAAWCAFVVGFSDNLVRPIILRARMPVPFPILVIVLVAGLRAFGLAGAFVGPLLAAGALSLSRALRRAEDAEGGPP